MSQNPLNLALLFLLEILALVSVGYWGWISGTGLFRFILAIGVPLVMAVIWGTLRVPGDASSSGRAPGPSWTSRLLIEAGVFGFAAWGLFDVGRIWLALVFAGVVLLHYALSYDRVAWLLKSPR